MRDYHHIKFGLTWIKESKVTEGGGIRPPLVENVLNRPGEIGLIEEPSESSKKNNLENVVISVMLPQQRKYSKSLQRRT